MRMMLGAGLLAVAMGATAASKEAEPVRFHANARVELDAHGVPRQVQVNEKLPPAIRSVVEQALRDWVTSMRYLPEEVDGKPIATRVVYPVAFSLPNVSIKQLREEQRDAARQSAECQAAVGESKDPQRPVVLDSPFKPVSTG